MTQTMSQHPSPLRKSAVEGSAQQFLSTAEAAKILGLSTSLVQSLVDSNDLQGWKTRGGHRRISLQSIQLYQKQACCFPVNDTVQTRSMKVVVVQEDPAVLAQLQQHLGQWKPGVMAVLFGSLTEAVLDMSRQPADMLVAELKMPRQQQQSTLQALQKFAPQGTRPPSLVVVTEEKNLLATDEAQNQGLQWVRGPMTALWLQAYLTGVTAACAAA